jgi:hypothetical protein
MRLSDQAAYHGRAAYLHKQHAFWENHRMKKFVSVIALACAATFSGNAMAQQVKPASVPAGTINPFVGFGYTFGGDKLATAVYTDGDSASIRAGQGFQINGGLEFLVSSSVSATASVGYHVDRTSANNGSLKFERVPVELMGHYKLNNQFRVGAGVRFVSSATFSGSGVVSTEDVEFDSTTGAVIQGEYFFSPALSLIVRGVSEKYKLDGQGSTDGSHVGVLLNVYWY